MTLVMPLGATAQAPAKVKKHNVERTSLQRAETKPSTKEAKTAVRPMKSKKQTQLSKSPISSVRPLLHSATKGSLKFNMPASPRRVEGSTPAIGAVTYSDLMYDAEDASVYFGMYSVPTDGASNNIEMIANVPVLAEYDIYGATICGDAYYAVAVEDWWGYTFVSVLKFDPETWELIETIDCGMDTELRATDMAYDPITGLVYGCFASDMGGYYFGSLDFNQELPATTYIADLAEGFNGCAIDGNGTFYGLSESGALCTVNKDNGEVTEIGNTGLEPWYFGSAAFDTRADRLYWNLNPSNGYSYMYEINKATAEATLLYECPNSEEIVGMYVPAPAADDNAPAAVTSLSANFADGALAGQITFTAPTTTFGGAELAGDVNITVLANGEEIAAETVAAGTEMTIPYEAAAAGNYRFIVTASNAAGESPKASVALWIGPDVPMAVKNVDLVSTPADNGVTLTLTWDPVEAGVNNGYLGEVTYNVYLHTSASEEATLYAEGLTECTYSTPYAIPESLTAVWFTVEAVADGMAATPTESNVVALGAAVPPFSVDFGTTDLLSSFTVIDANNDGKTWTPESGVMRMRYNSEMDMDDWLITPAIKLQAGYQYEFYFYAQSYLSSYPERVEAAWGTAPTVEGMADIIVEPTDLTSEDWTLLSAKVVPSADGEYYFGIHGISDADMFYLNVRELGVSAGTSAAAPAAPAGLKVVPNTDGLLEADVTFTAPDKTIGGDELTALDNVVVLCDGAEVETFSNVAPGQACECKVSVEENGVHIVTVVAANAAGIGNEATASAFFGIPAPAAPATASVVETSTPGEVTVSWDAVTTDAYGNPINPAFVSYAVVSASTGLVDIVTDCSLTYQAVEEGQEFVYFAVLAMTDGGESEYTYTNMIPAGAPFTLPYVETFVDGSLAYPMGTDADGGGSWSLYDNSYFEDIADSDDTNGFAGMRGSYVGNYADLFTGKINLNAENPILSLDYYVIAEDDENVLEVYVTEAGGEMTLVGSFLQNEGEIGAWNPASIDLTEYAGKDVQVTLRGIVNAYSYIFVDNIQIAQPKDNDLAIAEMETPAMVKPGEEFTVDVTVKNVGFNPAAEYTVQLFLEDELISEAAGKDLESLKSETFSFDCQLPATAAEENNYKAVVVYAADEDLENNTFEMSVILELPNFPVATNLQAVTSDEGVALTWDEPDMTNLPKVAVTEDFETADAFATEYLNNWLSVDVDGAAIGGVSGVAFPGLTAGVSTAAFFVMNNEIEELQGSESYAAHSGVQYAATMFNYEGSQQSDWLISPELSGDSQTVSFYAKSFSGSYLESFKVYYSMTDNETTSMIEADAYTSIPNAWTEYSVYLPSGAKYFAIECTSADKFMLFVDDITYVPADGEDMVLSIVGYNIYRNGEKINEAPVEECNFVDAEGANGDKYVVTVVYAEGESAPSEIVTAGSDNLNSINAISGVKVVNRTIVVTGATGNVSVYAADGKMIYSEAAAANNSVTVTPGVYVVKYGKLNRKVVVK